MKKIVLLFLIIIFLVGCSKTNTARTFTEDEARNYIKEAIINLNKTSNFEATSTVQILINGIVSSAKSGELISNSSNAYSVSLVEERNGNKNIVFKRIIFNNILYEYDNVKGYFNRVSENQSQLSLDYDYYQLNKALIIKFINQIYDQSNVKFGEFLKELTFEKEIKNKNGEVLVFTYKETKETEISNIEQSGEIFISHYDGEAIISQVKDTYHVVFKKDGTTADTITEVIINNISSAKKIGQPNIE
jgi:hypothetical protein